MQWKLLYIGSSWPLDLILSEHLTAARSAVRDTEILKELEAEIERDCDQLRSFLFAAQVMARYFGFRLRALTPIIGHRRNLPKIKRQYHWVRGEVGV